MVNIKLSFTDSLFFNYITLIKQCKIHYINLDKALLLLRNLIIFLENWKFWWTPTATGFLGSFYCLDSSFLLRSCVIDKPCFCECIETRLFCFGKELKIWTKWNKSQIPFWRRWEVGNGCKILTKIIK